MSLRSFYIALSVSLLASVHITSVKAFHPMNVKKLYDYGNDLRYKKDNTNFPTTDEDVLELEKLKQKPPSLENLENSSENTELNIPEDTLPELEKQLEKATISSKNLSINQGQPEKEEQMIVQHKPPIVTSHSNHDNYQNHHQDIPNTSIIEKSQQQSPPLKPFYGAARLAFGQNPEVITTSSTTTAGTPTVGGSITTTTSGLSTSSLEKENENSKESEISISGELEATKNGERRSVDRIPPKFSENLLRQKNGHYSAFDMAEYVFWTGDEAGVAKAVEELIHQGLMSRENAIKFLRDIRLGIEYLQSSYTNRIFPDHVKGNTYYTFPSLPTTTTTTTTMATTTTKPSTKSDIEQQQPQNIPNNSDFYKNIQNTFEGIPSLLRLNELNNVRKKDNSVDYDEINGKTKITEFLYAENSLEEVIYQLAKVMFSQSLMHGSEQSQRALQKLTEFLEAEGERGRISPALQKKVLDVLLTALSDTLAEHPELLAAARSGLGNTFHKLPKSSINP